MSGPPAYPFTAQHRPLFPGSPYIPPHTRARRIAYAASAVLMSVSAGLGSALVSVNLPNLAGGLGVTTAEAGLLPAVFVAMLVSANLVLVKARQQFGIPAIMFGLLLVHAAVGLLQLAAPGFGTALFGRAVAGITAAGLTTMTVYCLLQVVPPPKRPLALVTALSLGQFASPLARLVPVEILALDHWQGLHLIELGLAFAAIAAMLALPLPPSDRTPAFEPLDLVTVALAVPGVTLVCVVLGEGRSLWWADTPWLGLALAAAVPLLLAAGLIEHYRARPLLQTRWLGTLDIARFAVVAVLVRLALAEQTYGAVGLLTAAGLTNDQLRLLFVLVLAAMALGLGTTLVILTPTRIPYMIMSACLAIAIGAGLDSQANNLTRPAQLMLSQALLGFGTMLFIGPALVFAFTRMLQRGPGHLVTFVVLFSSSQNVGGLAGSALLGSYQTLAARAHALALAERALLSDPFVATRLAAQGVGGLSQALQREANVLAFNDVFRAVAALALLTAAYLIYIRLYTLVRQRRAAREASA